MVQTKPTKMSSQNISTIRWQFEVLSYCLIPFLGSRDLASLSRVSKGMKECVCIGLEPILLKKKKHVTDYFNYINHHFQTNVLKNAMLDKYQIMLKKGLRSQQQRSMCSENSFFATDDASMTLLIFYLRSKAPHILKHMLHCVVNKWCAYNRRIFRRTHLRVEMYFLSKKKGVLHKKGINKPPVSKKAMSKSLKSASTNSTNSMSLPNLPLTEENLHTHTVETNKRTRQRDFPKRVSKKAKLYQDEYQKDVQISDDFKEEEVLLDDRSDCSSGIEKRSEDSQSEGSLKDFIVNDDDEDDEAIISTEEDECSIHETTDEEESVHTSDLSDVFSDDE